MKNNHPKVSNVWQQMKPEQIEYQAQILANRVLKNYNHFRKRFARQEIDCFRLYDWDIPEVRAVVDWYKGHIVIAEYVRKQTEEQWLPRMAEAVAEALNLPKENIHIKHRRTKTEYGLRYDRLDSTGNRFQVKERDLKFWVNLDDFLDTGLYPDHRETRVIIRDIAKGKDFLNLFAYTGAFTCAAAKGGANKTVTVDRSATNLDWAKDNIELNGLSGDKHIFMQSDVDKYLKKTREKGRKFTLAFVDPPSFFQDKSQGVSFDVNRDHPNLISGVIEVMASGSEVFFSTNHQRFEPKMESLSVSSIKEITPKTIPEDYRNKQVHRCWRMTVK